MAFSEKFDDPCFNRYRRHYRINIMIWTGGLMAAALIGFYIYAQDQSGDDQTEAYISGSVIATMFFLIGLYAIFDKRKKRDWIGEVVEKRIDKVKGDDVYRIFIEHSNGKIHERNATNDSTRYDYYKIGDLIKYHGKLNSIEKFDKSEDEIIFCNACSYLNDIEEDRCVMCKCVLLK